MAILISAHNITKSFSVRPLFEGLSFAVASGERVGLIGPNGAGKSTLLKILAGIDTVDSGTVSFQRGLKVAYLEQTPKFKSDATIYSTLMEGASDPDDWESIAAVEERLSHLPLAAAKLTPDSLLNELSGGWKKRVALSRELIKQPDLLLLDEPTNHLDVESILWLEELLANSRFATITITHDRVFLQRVSNRIVELDRRLPGGLLSINGDYLQYLEARELLVNAQERREVILKNTLRRETEWLKRGAKARTTKQQARIERHGELVDEVGELNYRNQNRITRIDFQSAENSPKKLIEAKSVTKFIHGEEGQRLLFKDMNLVMGPGSRVGLLGPNGCGKSTLIRTLLGQEEPDTGTVIRSDRLKVAYFEQNRESLNPNLTIAKTLCPVGDTVDYRGARVHIRGYLDRFLFTKEQMEMSVGKLSGGEQSRILVAKLMLQEANMLVLDEPTNDLDTATLSVLEECLTEFSGAVLLVTHDRYFLDQVANQILAFDTTKPGELVSFSDLSQWEKWYDRREQLLKNPPKKEVAKSSAPATSAVKKKLSFHEQREFDQMEETIHKAEGELQELTRQSESPDNLTQAKKLLEITQKMATQQAVIDRLYKRWSELEAMGAVKS